MGNLPPTPADGAEPPRLRAIRDGGFAWQSKAVRREIRKRCLEPGTALAVYAALTEIASDEEAEEFKTTHAWLAALSGFSERTVRNRLRELQGLGFISVSTPALRAPSTFRLLPSGNGCPTSGNGCPTSGNGCRAFGNGEAVSLPPSEQLNNRKVCVGVLPVGFPTSEAEAVSQCEGSGIDGQILVDAFNEANSRGGCDRHGQPIVNFPSYAKNIASYRRAFPRKRPHGANGKALGLLPGQQLKLWQDRVEAIRSKLTTLPAGGERLALIAEKKQLEAKIEGLAK